MKKNYKTHLITCGHYGNPLEEVIEETDIQEFIPCKHASYCATVKTNCYKDEKSIVELNSFIINMEDVLRRCFYNGKRNKI